MTITGVKVVNKAGEKQNSLEMAECLNENAYDDRTCVGIFDSYYKAYECVMNNWRNWYTCCSIFEFEINEYYSMGIDADRLASWSIDGYTEDEKTLTPSPINKKYEEDD